MTKPTVVPINKRFPGEHTIRFRLWTPTGASVGFEGRTSRALCGFLTQAAIHGLTADETSRLDDLTEAIRERKRRRKEGG